MQSFTRTQVMTRVALLSAMATMLMIVISLPLMPAAPFLKYEPSDVMSILAAVTLGPWYGVLTALLKVVLAFLIKGGNPVSYLMNVAATGSLVLVIGYVFQAWPNSRGLLAGGIVGAVLMAALMVPLNLFVVPWLHGIPAETVRSMILPVYIPFNLLKGLISTGLGVLLYGALGSVLKPAGLQAGSKPPRLTY